MYLQGHTHRRLWSKTNTEGATEERTLTVREIMRRTMARKSTMVMIVGSMCRRLLWRDTMGSKVMIMKSS